MRRILELVDTIHRRIGVRFPPLRLEEFLSRHDSYRVFEVDLPPGLDGEVFLSPDGEHKTIRLRRQNPRPRLRFTLAHEIMHAELHFPEGKLTNLRGCRTNEHHRDRRRNLLEREADFGAAALLMPLWMIDRHRTTRPTPSDPTAATRELARVFRVSEAAMRIRLQTYEFEARRLGDTSAYVAPSGLAWFAAAPGGVPAATRSSRP